MFSWFTWRNNRILSTLYSVLWSYQKFVYLCAVARSWPDKCYCSVLAGLGTGHYFLWRGGGRKATFYGNFFYVHQTANVGCFQRLFLWPPIFVALFYDLPIGGDLFYDPAPDFNDPRTVINNDAPLPECLPRIFLKFHFRMFAALRLRKTCPFRRSETCRLNKAPGIYRKSLKYQHDLANGEANQLSTQGEVIEIAKIGIHPEVCC